MAITELKDVNTWEDYEEYVRNTDPEAWKIHEEAHKFAKAMCYIMDDLEEMGQTIEIHDHTSTFYDTDEPSGNIKSRKNFSSDKKRKHINRNRFSKLKRVRARSLS